jgi:ADP-ribosylglycohydrolase
MLGGIVGDIAGSFLEHNEHQLKTYNLLTGSIFCDQAEPTDDSVLLAATGAAILDDSDDFETYYKRFANSYPDANYGPGFQLWLAGDSCEYQSFGNGAASRAGVIGYLDNEEDVLALARKSAMVSHKHEEGIAGAEAMAWSVWARRQFISKEEIFQELYRKWNYYVGSKSHDLETINKEIWYWDCSAVNTVPLAIYIAFFHGNDYKSAIRAAQYIGGDVDTIACMAGLLKSQDHDIDADWALRSKRILWTKTPKILDIIERFDARFAYSNLPF